GVDTGGEGERQIAAGRDLGGWGGGEAERLVSAGDGGEQDAVCRTRQSCCAVAAAREQAGHTLNEDVLRVGDVEGTQHRLADGGLDGHVRVVTGHYQIVGAVESRSGVGAEHLRVLQLHASGDRASTRAGGGRLLLT